MDIHEIPSAALADGQQVSLEVLWLQEQCLPNQFMYFCNLMDQTVEKIVGVESVLGYTAEEFASLPFFQLSHIHDRNTIIAVINEGYAHLVTNKEIEPLKAQFSVTHRILHRDGTYRHIFHQIAYVGINPYGDALKVVNVCTDVSHLPFSGVTANLICKCMGLGSNFTSLRNPPVKQGGIFSPREQEILQLLMIGKTSFEISRILCISKHTVDKHRSNMLNKTQSNNTRELIANYLWQ